MRTPTPSRRRPPVACTIPLPNPHLPSHRVQRPAAAGGLARVQLDRSARIRKAWPT
jgi:hypothetical protein